MNIKNRTYYFFIDNVGIEHFGPNNIKMDKMSHKDIVIYYIGYVTIKKQLKISSVNPLYHIFN